MSWFWRPTPDPVGAGQESVWDYPRTPLVQRVRRRAVLRHAGILIADTDDLVRMLEIGHPPTYYLPRAAFDANVLVNGKGQTWCEWKGVASYLDLVVPGADRLVSVGWWYPRPDPRYLELTDRVALYAEPLDCVTLDGERVTPQPGGFYGGWITPDVVGPFKGVPGSSWW
jgi:uncharacterized protein (DUF427 family)